MSLPFSIRYTVRTSALRDILFSLLWGGVSFAIVAAKPFLMLWLFRLLNWWRRQRQRMSESGAAPARTRLGRVRQRLQRSLLRGGRRRLGVDARRPYDKAGDVSNSADQYDAVYETPDEVQHMRHTRQRAFRSGSGIGEEVREPQQQPGPPRVGAVFHVPSSQEPLAAQRHGGSTLASRSVKHEHRSDAFAPLDIDVIDRRPWWAKLVPPLNDRMPVITEDSLRYSQFADRVQNVAARARIDLMLAWARLVVDLATVVIYVVEGMLQRSYIGYVFYWPVGAWFAVNFAGRVFLFPHRGSYYFNFVFTLDTVAECLSIPSTLRAASGVISFVNFNFLRAITAFRSFLYLYNREMLYGEYMYIGKVGRYVVSLSVYLFAIIFSLGCLMFTIEYISGDSAFTPVTSFYFMVVTLATVGYGDFVPTNDVSRIYVVIVIVVMVAYFGYSIGNIISISNLNKEGKGSFHAMSMRRHVVLTGFPSFSEIERSFVTFFGERRNVLSYFVVFLDDPPFEENEWNSLRQHRHGERLRFLLGNVLGAFHRHRVDAANAECFFLLGGTGRAGDDHGRGITGDSELLLRARSLLVYHGNVPLYLLYRTPFAARQLEDMYLSRRVPLAQVTARTVHVATRLKMLEYETRTVCAMELDAALLASNVMCNGTSTLLHNALLDGQEDRPLCRGDARSLVEYKLGIRSKLRRVSVPRQLAGRVRLGSLAQQSLLFFETAVVGLFSISHDGVWEMHFNPDHLIDEHAVLFVLCARHQFGAFVNWLTSDAILDDLWMAAEPDETNGSGLRSWQRRAASSRSSKSSRAFARNTTLQAGLADVGARSRHHHRLSPGPVAMPGPALTGPAATRPRNGPTAANTTPEPTPNDETGAAPHGSDLRRLSMSTASSAAEPHLDLSSEESDADDGEEMIPEVIVACSAPTICTVFLELFLRSIRLHVCMVRDEEGVAKATANGDDQPGARPLRYPWHRTALKVVVLAEALSSEAHFQELSDKYGPLEHVRGSPLRIPDLQKLRAHLAYAVILPAYRCGVAGDDLSGSGEGVEVFAMVNVDLALRHFATTTYVCAHISEPRSLGTVHRAMYRRLGMRLGLPLDLSHHAVTHLSEQEMRRLSMEGSLLHGPGHDVGETRPSPPGMRTPSETEHAATAAHRGAMAPPAADGALPGDAPSGEEHLRYRSRFSSGEMLSRLLATEILVRQQSLPGIVLLVKVLLGMSLSHGESLERRSHLCRPHLYMVSLPAALDGSPYSEVAEYAIAAGALPLGLYRSMTHDVRVSVHDVEQLIMSRYAVFDPGSESDAAPFHGFREFIHEMAARQGDDATDWLQQIGREQWEKSNDDEEEQEEESDPEAAAAEDVGDGPPRRRGRGGCGIGAAWCGACERRRRRRAWANRVVNLGPTDNRLPFTFTNPPGYVRVARGDGLYVTVAHFDKFACKFHRLVADAAAGGGAASKESADTDTPPASTDDRAHGRATPAPPDIQDMAVPPSEAAAAAPSNS